MCDLIIFAAQTSSEWTSVFVVSFPHSAFYSFAACWLSASRLAIWQGKRSVSLCLSESSKPRRFAYFAGRFRYGRFSMSEQEWNIPLITTNQQNRVIKLTQPGTVGYSMSAEGIMARPLEYLDRRAWLNHLFSDDIRIVAASGNSNLLQVVTSQP